MRKIRTLTKKSLDELEKVMPRISEIDQRTFVGSDHYYNINGDFAFSTPGDRMWIVPSAYVPTILSGLSDVSYQTIYNCHAFGSASGTHDAAETKILRDLIQSQGYNGTFVVNNEGNGAEHNGRYSNQNGVETIYVYRSSSLYQQGMRDNMIGIIVHEVDHKELLVSGYSDSITSDFAELSANWAQMNDFSYSGTTSSRKVQIIERYQHFYNLVKANDASKHLLDNDAYGDGTIYGYQY